MPERVILLSGPVESGKSVLSRLIQERYNATIFKTNELIRKLKPRTAHERKSLQRAGTNLDRKTKGRWVCDAFQKSISELDYHPDLVIVDSVRRLSQINAIRDAYGSRVVHIHLTAQPDELSRRYIMRHGSIQELPSYDEVQRDPTERRVNELQPSADILICTDRCSEEDIVTGAAGHLGFLSRLRPRVVDVVVGGQYGSEGKGHVVSYLAAEYDYLIRVGGPNAGHTVFERPTNYTFHHLPSGTRCSEARLLIGPGAVISVPKLMLEIGDCKVRFDRLSIDPRAMVITDDDLAFEKRLIGRIGSTGQGVGKATARRILDRGSEVLLARDVDDLKPFIRDTGEILENAIIQGRKILLEGTQGTGLSLFHGDYPWVTSRDTTVSGCLAEAGIAPAAVRRIVMACRTFPIRVQSPDGGTSGRMCREITWQEVASRSGVDYRELLKNEKTSTTKRRRRVAEFDWRLLRRSTQLNGPTDIALTFADYLSVGNRNARRFDQLTDATIQFVEEIEKVAAAPVSLISTRFHFRSIIDRRKWSMPDTTELVELYPELYHMASLGSWQSIKRHGLLSTSALLDLLTYAGLEREAIESRHRPETISIRHPDYGSAQVRDQKPMSDGALQRCLQDSLTPANWYGLLNSKVFFWPTKKRLCTMLNARPYRADAHDVLIVDTAKLLQRHLSRVTLSPMNSGCTKPRAWPRGRDTFRALGHYPLQQRRQYGRNGAVAEFAVDRAVGDISELVLRVQVMRGSNIEKVL